MRLGTILLCFHVIVTYGQDLPKIVTTVTVTAERGASTEAETVASVAQATSQEQYRILPLPTIGNALEGMAGLLIQQSTYGQVSPFLRGLTGYQVLNLVDGIRFNNATFRSGPNQYLAFVEPSQAFRMETVLGPTGAQYGSDAMGGVIQVLTPPALFPDGQGLSFHGQVSAFGATADRSGGGNGQISLGSERFAWIIGGSGRSLGDVRGGQSTDSRHVLRRLFNLDNSLIRQVTGDRMVDTGFDQYGFHTKFNARPSQGHLLTLWYQRSGMDDVRGYKDLWGGLGRLQSAFTPQVLNFAYARYEKIRLGPLDTVSGTFSVNDQRDGNLRQNLRATDPITLDDASVRSYGYTGQAAKSWSGRHTLIFGGDLYDERIDSFRIVTAPPTGVRTEQRALYPNGSRYRTFGTFAQASFELLPQRLRAMVAGRFTNVGFETFANRNRTSDGRQLGVTDTQQDFRDFTYQASLTWRATQLLSLHVLAGRGFRAPNLNDLGAVGLNDLGFEIPASDSVAAGALLANSAGENALSLNRSVASLSPESLRNYEAGVTLRTDRLYLRLQGFHADLYDPIVRRTLLFPAGSVPSSIGGIAVAPIQPTPAQQAQGVVTVATAVDPRAVKAFVNDGQTRYYGMEWIAKVAIARHLSTEAAYSFLVGRDLYPNRNVRRLPPQSGMWSVRYQPRRWWLEARAIVSGAQTRLSGGDADDERIGASRRRSDIADFFNGTLVSPWIANGRFTPTGETLTEIQNRVLPIGSVINGVRVADNATRVPLYLSTAGWVSVDVVGGIPIGERWTIGGGIRNLADRNYRMHGSGVDSTGRNLFANLQYRW